MCSDMSVAAALQTSAAETYMPTARERDVIDVAFLVCNKQFGCVPSTLVVDVSRAVSRHPWQTTGAHPITKYELQDMVQPQGAAEQKPFSHSWVGPELGS